MERVKWQALEFNSNVQVTKRQRGNGLVTKYGYDALSHTLLSIRTYGNRVTVQDIKYTLNDAENVIERVDGTKGLQESFEYDELNRIIRASRQGSGTPFVQEFRYDDNSNGVTAILLVTMCASRCAVHSVGEVNIDGRNRHNPRVVLGAGNVSVGFGANAIRI